MNATHMQVQEWEVAVTAANARTASLSQQLTAAHDRTTWLEAEVQRQQMLSQQMQV